eukprot:gb/GECH01002814.1/.p1 GENE.gb/GECH01002814.1/~~gb/GECH01002814.1/.p1  ORF type:complete len:305 (+),score=95.98 gb/GECH01002814.1/:1-915(+)
MDPLKNKKDHSTKDSENNNIIRIIQDSYERLKKEKHSLFKSLTTMKKSFQKLCEFFLQNNIESLKPPPFRKCKYCQEIHYRWLNQGLSLSSIQSLSDVNDQTELDENQMQQRHSKWLTILDGEVISCLRRINNIDLNSKNVSAEEKITEEEEKENDDFFPKSIDRMYPNSIRRDEFLNQDLYGKYIREIEKEIESEHLKHLGQFFQENEMKELPQSNDRNNLKESKQISNNKNQEYKTDQLNLDGEGYESNQMRLFPYRRAPEMSMETSLAFQCLNPLVGNYRGSANREYGGAGRWWPNTHFGC